MTKEGFFKKYEFVYDEYYDYYICPADRMLTYRITNKEGYREYKSNKSYCKDCPYLSQRTESKEHEKVITRHIWEEYLEISADIRHTLGNKEIYALRKETIERLFGSAKEQHGFRYTQYWESPDEYESRVDHCVHESEKAGKDSGYEKKEE